jgi:hypothetical protein
MVRYTHVVGVWAGAKFRLVPRALWLGSVAIPLWMIALLILAISG